MANLNLSQFGENTSVSDADYTFVWDSAASISKKVSRNSWLNSGTLTSDAPVTISQTWGTTGTYTAFKVVATETLGAAAASNLLELWSGNAATLKLFVKKNGDLAIRDQGQIGTPNFLLGSGSGSGIYFASGDLRLYVDPGSAKFVMSNAQTAIKIGANYSFGWAATADAALTLDTILLRDGAPNTLALRNGAAAQTFNVYGTSSASNANYARLALTCGLDGNATILTQAAGSGVAGTVSINGVPVGLGKGNVSSNLAIGTSALAANTTGTNNVALGPNVLLSNTTGTFNFGLAENALRENTTGSFNAALGASALQLNTTGSNNTALGVGAGAYAYNGGTLLNNTNSSSSIFIGRDTRPDNLAQNNQIVIGYQAIGIGSNSVVLGNDSITKTALKGNVGIGTTSPTSKLQVSAGDVEVDTIAKGVILKSPDGTRYRVTVANGGTLSVAAV